MEETKNRIEQYREKLFTAQRIAVIQECPDEEPTPEYIEERCTQLRNQIIDSENINNRFRNPTLQKIFTAPPRFKKL